MSTRWEWLVGTRYLRSAHRRGFVSFVAAISVIGLMLGVATLIGNLAGFLKDKQNIPVFNSAQQDGAMIFGVTAITMEGNTPSVMVLGANTASKDGSVKLQLMYLDHQQFIEQQAADAETAPGSV